jgi:hypothetical protein
VGTVLAIPLVIRQGNLIGVLLGIVAVVVVSAAMFLVARRPRGAATTRLIRARSRSSHWALDLRISLIILFVFCRTAIAVRQNTSVLIATAQPDPGRGHRAGLDRGAHHRRASLPAADRRRSAVDRAAGRPLAIASIGLATGALSTVRPPWCWPACAAGAALLGHTAPIGDHTAPTATVPAPVTGPVIVPG